MACPMQRGRANEDCHTYSAFSVRRQRNSPARPIFIFQEYRDEHHYLRMPVPPGTAFV